jgi:RNA polymerase sigma-70 factor, ECF subfamily
MGVGGLEAVFRQEAARLWRALMVYTAGRSSVAEDAVSEAFSRALSQEAEIRDPVAWLYRVAFRIAAEEMRQQRRSSEQISRVVETGPDLDELEEVFAALRLLPANQRAAVFLHYQCDLPVAEVAKRLGVSRPTARVHLWRGRARLRTLLGDGRSE